MGNVNRLIVRQIEAIAHVLAGVQEHLPQGLNGFFLRHGADLFVRLRQNRGIIGVFGVSTWSPSTGIRKSAKFQCSGVHSSLVEIAWFAM